MDKRSVTLDQALYELGTELTDEQRRESALRIIRASSLEMLPSRPQSQADYLRLYTLDRVMQLYAGSSHKEDIQYMDDFLLWMSQKRERPLRTGRSTVGGVQFLISPHERAD